MEIETDLQRLMTEVHIAGELSETGLHSQFTRANFPVLIETEPKRFAQFQITALKRAYWGLDETRAFVASNQESYAGISQEMASLVDMGISVSKEFFPENGEKDSCAYPVFWMTSDERSFLESAMKNGFVDSINTINFPSLVSINRSDLLRLRLRASENKLMELRKTKATQSHTGFSLSNGDAHKVKADLKDVLKVAEREYAQIVHDLSISSTE